MLDKLIERTTPTLLGALAGLVWFFFLWKLNLWLALIVALLGAAGTTSHIKSRTHR